MISDLEKELKKEIERCSKIFFKYAILAVGRFAAIMIKNQVKEARKAIKNQDTVAMVKSLASLRDVKE